MNIFKKYKLHRYLNFFMRNNNMDNITIKYSDYIRMFKGNRDSILVDVRNPREYYENHLPGAINIPVYDIEEASLAVLKNKSRYIFVYCKTGSRSKKAAKILLNLGYLNVYNLIDAI